MTACGGAGDEGWSAADVAEDEEAHQRCREGTAGGGEEWAVFGAAAVVVVDHNAVVVVAVVVGLGNAARGGGVSVAFPAHWVRGWDLRGRGRGRGRDRGEGVPRGGGSARPSRDS